MASSAEGGEGVDRELTTGSDKLVVTGDLVKSHSVG